MTLADAKKGDKESLLLAQDISLDQVGQDRKQILKKVTAITSHESSLSLPDLLTGAEKQSLDR